MSENDSFEDFTGKLARDPARPPSVLGEAVIEDDTEIEATPAELAWYRAMARNMQYYGKQYFRAFIGMGLACFYGFALPSRDHMGQWYSMDMSALLMMGFLPPLIFTLFGYLAWRSSSFPAVAPKTAFSGQYDTTVTKSGFRQWLGYHILLMPNSLTKTLHRGQRYVGEGFKVHKGGEYWLIPVKMGEWQVRENDKPEPLNRVAGWLIFTAFQIVWPVCTMPNSAIFHATGVVPALQVALFWAVFLLWLGTLLALGGILIYRWNYKKTSGRYLQGHSGLKG